MSLIARRLRIEGRVQGVGFRYALYAEALRLGLSGWVRNHDDGDVEALICGTPDAVDALTVWAHRGPDTARVLRVLCTDEPGTDSLEHTGPFRLLATR